MVLVGSSTTRVQTLVESESKELLKRYGVPVVDEKIASDEDDAVRTALEVGFPVVVKGLGSTLLHKTERGLVHLNLSDSQAVRNAVRAIVSEAREELDGFLIQPYLSGKREFIAGLFRDNQFGPVVMFGVGGVFAEAFSDVTFRLVPLAESDAEEMLDEIKGQTVLGDFRGEDAVRRDALIRTLLGLSHLAMENPHITEVDINPLVITPEGNAWAVDALVVLGRKKRAGRFIPPVEPNAIGSLFHPKSIAFVGASAQMGKWGHMLLTNTIAGGYQGTIYLVNPKGGTIAGRKVYRSVAEIPGSVDLGVVTIPASKVIDLIPSFHEKGIRNMLLITSGFGETGAKGKDLEKKLAREARKAGILVLGPNTMGICNPHIQLYCTGFPVRPSPGSTTVVAQSGNLGTQLLAFAEEQGIGIRGFCGSGNEAMMTIEDYLDGLRTDPLTHTAILYIESVKNGSRFFESARRLGEKKPVVLLKGGRSRAGDRAAASHTGALASDLRVFQCMCRQAGIVSVDQPMDLLDLAAAFSSLPLPQGNRAAIMTLGGGWGVVTADLCSDHGLEVPELSQEILNRLDERLPPYWSRSNPVDLVGEEDPAIPMTIVEELLKWKGCDAVIDLGILGRGILVRRFADSVSKADPTYTREFLDAVNRAGAEFEERYLAHLGKLMHKYRKPVFSVSLLAGERNRTVYPVAESPFKVVSYPTPERAVKAFAKMVEYFRFLTRRGVRKA